MVVVVALLLMLPLDHRHFWYHLLLMIWLLLPMTMQQFGYTVQNEVYVGGYTIVMYVFIPTWSIIYYNTIKSKNFDCFHLLFVW